MNFFINTHKEDKEFSLQTEHIAKALDGGIPVRAHAHRADDILTAIRLRDEFHLDLVIMAIVAIRVDGVLSLSP